MKQEQTGAVIVEVRGNKAVALTEQGEFIRVHNEGYTVGQQALLIPQPEVALPVRRRMRVTAYAAMTAGFLLLLFGGFKGYTMPVGVVSLDVNPSIEYTINAFDRVLDISAVNDDAGLILAGMDENALLYRPIDEAVDVTILTLRENGYLSDATENDVVISASSFDLRHTERIAERLGVRVRQHGDLTVYSVAVSNGEVEYAHARGTSAGKFYIIEELEDSWAAPESFDSDDWIARPIREIILETKTQRESRDDDGDDEDREWSANQPFKTPTGQQSTNPEGNQQYQNQQNGSFEQESESDDEPEQEEPNHK
ncbi:MAG: hypothetical protein C0413_00875 [Clostridiales bacterium]|nr:hypothetical protein [Clostridiales bacterium]